MKIAVVNIYASFNNTKLLATDVTESETITKVSGGMMTKSQSKEGSAYVGMKAAEQLANNLKDKGYRDVIVKVRATGGIRSRSPGQGADSAITSLTRSGLNILEIINVTPLPHDGCKKRKRDRAKKK